MLAENIRANWKTDILGYAQIIPALKDTSYPAWTVKLIDGYGVAIPYSGEDINESFSSVHIYSTESIILGAETTEKTLVLVTESAEMSQPFAALCSELIDPGKDGCFRNGILQDPVSWW